MNCIIVDDEPLARQGLEMNIGTIPSLQMAGSFSNAFAANDFLRKNAVDLMFLDINMPDLSGLDFLRSLREAPMVIFTTAYPQYALESYELDAIDYLVKPFRIERFIKAVNKAQGHLKLIEQSGSGSQVENIGEDFIFIKSDRKYLKIHFRDILYIEGLKDYVILFTSTSKVMTSMNVKTICAQLPPNIFARVSKSYIVNLLHTTAVDNEFVYIGETDIPLGQTFKDEFMKQYVEGKVVKR
jgi:DNA-binding LytR/AlgR family response regulator